MQIFTVSTAVLCFLHLICTTTSEKDWFDDISVEDVLASGINGSEKVEKKIVNTVINHVSSGNSYKKIDLPIEGFTFPKNYSITVNLGSENVIFHNISFSKLSPTTMKSYSTSVKCDSTRMAKVEVKLPRDLEISAHLKVTKITNSSNEFQSTDILNEGSISVILKGTSISNQISVQTNDTNSIEWKMFYSKSTVSLDIGKKFQIPIYSKLQTIFDEVEFLVIKKFEIEFARSGISITNDCSKFMNIHKNSKLVNLPFYIVNLNNVYQIENEDINWSRECDFQNASIRDDDFYCYANQGPILIYDLTNFSSTEVVVSENETLSQDGSVVRTIPRYDDPKIKETTVKFRTNPLKGKSKFLHFSKSVSVTFTLDFIEFEISKKSSVQNKGEGEGEIHYQFGTHKFCVCKTSKTINQVYTEVVICLANLHVECLKSSGEKFEIADMDALHGVLLAFVVRHRMVTSLLQRLQEESSFANRP